MQKFSESTMLTTCPMSSVAATDSTEHRNSRYATRLAWRSENSQVQACSP